MIKTIKIIIKIRNAETATVSCAGARLGQPHSVTMLDPTPVYKGTELSSSLNAKQNNINTYTITGATGGSLSFASGTLTLAMPNNYTANMTLSNLTTPTSFIYKGTELSTSHLLASLS